jgi:hypothetical protein
MRKILLLTFLGSLFFFHSDAQIKRIFLNGGIYNPIAYVRQQNEYYGADRGEYLPFTESGGSLVYTQNTFSKRSTKMNSIGGVGFSLTNSLSNIFSFEGSASVNAIQLKTETIDLRWGKLYNSSNLTEASIEDSLYYLPYYEDLSSTAVRIVPTVNIKIALGVNLENNSFRAAISYSHLPINYIESFLTGGLSYERRFRRVYGGIEIQRVISTLPDRNYNLKSSFGLIFNLGLCLPQSQKAIDREKSKNSPSIL